MGKINKTVILLAPFDYHVDCDLSKYVNRYLVTTMESDKYYYKPLQEIFDKVIPYNYPRRLTEIGPKGVNDEVIEIVKREHPQYALWVTAYYEFQESTFQAIRKEGTKVIALMGDDEIRFDNYSKYWGSFIDYFATNDVSAVQKYKDIKAKPILAIPIMGGLAVPRDWSKIEEKYDVTFVGGKTIEREEYIKEIKKENIQVNLFGKGWGNDWETFISFEEMIEVFKTSKINLNFLKNARGRVNEGQLKGRIFEVTLAGGFLLTEHVEHIEDYFEIGKEIVCFDTPGEMVEKIKYYLSHDQERRAIARAGWERARNSYDSYHVLSKLFNEIERDAAMGVNTNIDFDAKPSPYIRQEFSKYYSNWGVAFMLGNYDKKLYNDSFALASQYDTSGFRTKYYRFVGNLPFFLRKFFTPLMASLGAYMALRQKMRNIPYFKEFERMVKKFSYPLQAKIFHP
jgi:spore maturation protein CgeB